MHHIEIKYKVLQIEKEPDLAKRKAELVELGKQVKRLEIVNKCAAEKKNTMGSVDEVELYLVYQTELSKIPGLLPISTTQRLFGERVTDEDIEMARKKVNALTDQDYSTFLDKYDPYQKCLRQEKVDSLNYEDLTVFKGEVEKDLTCVLTQYKLHDKLPDETFSIEHPVLLIQESENSTGETIRTQYIFEWEDICTAWINKPENPSISQRFDIIDLKKVLRN